MTVESILEKKREELAGMLLPSLEFTVDEINTLTDIDGLCVLKLRHTFPENFEFAHTAMQNFSYFEHGDQSLYRILELCMLKNPSLRMSVCTVFPQFSKCYAK